MAEFPLPEEQFVLLDVDGTLTDNEVSLRHPGIYRSVQAAEAAGWRVGFNSNRSLAVLQYWQYCLDTSGPIIAEGGAVVGWNDEVHYTDPRVPVVADQYAAVRAKAQEVLRSKGIIVDADPDPMRAMVENRFRGAGPPGKAFSLFSSSRMLGMSVFPRVITPEGGLTQDPNLTVEVAGYLAPFALGEPMLHHDAGLVGSSKRLTTKREGVLAFRRLSGTAGRVAMIGNRAKNDFLGRDVAVHYAVGDARDFREADYVSHSSNTAGVVEILGRLVS